MSIARGFKTFTKQKVMWQCQWNTFCVTSVDSFINFRAESRKLFGGYRITPRYCKATKSSSHSTEGPNICMFNHECTQRNGQVVGACMDGFLFGACCQLGKGKLCAVQILHHVKLPSTDEEIGDFLSQEYPGVTLLNSKITPTTHRTTSPYDITSHGVSQITATLLGHNPPFSNHLDPWTGTTSASTTR